MSHHLATFDTRIRPRISRRSIPSGLLAVAAALLCSPLFVVAADDAARANTTSAPQEEIAWMSGGVGDEALDDMRKVAAAYNVQLVFSDRGSSYLAAIPFTVARLAPGNSQPIYSAVSDGPLLYLKLPPGSYQIAAEIDGVWQSQHVQAGAPGSPAKVSFVSRGK
jgi:hypothetical protein